MLVCFKSFDVSHEFPKTADLVRNQVVWVNMAIYQSTHISNQFSVKQIKWVNCEAQFLRIFCSLYFETKCNNHKRDSFDFFYQQPFLPLKVCIIILMGITKPCTHLHPAPSTSTQLQLQQFFQSSIYDVVLVIVFPSLQI